MLEWASPWWVAALPLALAAPWLARRPRLAWSSLDAVRASPTLRVVLAGIPRAAGSLALGLLCLALARPQDVDRNRVVEEEGIDIMLVLDTSGSMEAEDYSLGGRAASRIEVAKEVAARFVEGRPDDRVGLVVFGEEAFTQVPLTTDHASLADFVGQIRLGMAGERMTAVGDGLAVASRRLKELERKQPTGSGEGVGRIVILLTDGRNNAGQVSPMQAAEAASALGIRVYTIGVGSAGGGGGGFFGAFARGRSDLDEKTLQAIAAVTGGQYFRADDTRALVETYATIDRLEKSTAEVREYVHREERYHGLLAGGLVLLLLQVVLGETLMRRLP